MTDDDATPRRDPAGRASDDGPATPTDRAHAEQDLKATVASIRADIGRLAAIEDQKVVLDPADPRIDAASEESVVLADRIAREARAQRQLGRELE